jgi:hypothetical protein
LSAIVYNMKSSASSIQPSFAAASTRHCSAVIVRYQGWAAAAACADMRLMGDLRRSLLF